MERIALSIAKALPAALPKLATSVGRTLLGDDVVPEYSADLPGGGHRRPALRTEAPDAIYFASCTGTMFGPEGGDGVADSFQRLCERAEHPARHSGGPPLAVLRDSMEVEGPTDGYAVPKAKVAESLKAATRDGELTVVCDASSCTEGLEVLLEAAGSMASGSWTRCSSSPSECCPRCQRRTKLPP